MTVNKNSKIKRLKINLSGPNGNAFCILGYVSTLGEMLGMEENEMQSIRDEMISSDYDNLISVFVKHFGDLVIIYR